MKSIFFIVTAFLLTNSLLADEKRKEVGDYNFDGYDDYRVYMMPNGKMILWDYFLFDPKDKNHKKYNALTDLWNPKFSKEDKRIITFSTGGHASVIFTSDTYIWNNGEIQLIESTKQDWDRKTGLYVNVFMKRMDGEMRVNKILLLDENEAKKKSLEYSE